MDIHIKNGRVIDPFTNTDTVRDIYIKDGVLAEKSVGRVIDATGLWVFPGFIDLHTHLREPGSEYKEDIRSGSKAALAGGFTAVVAMPNTAPVVDNYNIVDYISKRAESIGLIDVYIAGAVTKGMEGTRLSKIIKEPLGGCTYLRCFSEDGLTVSDKNIMRDAFLLCKEKNLPMFSHCENINAIYPDAESDIIARDIELAKDTGARLHICHVSTAKSVKLINRTKKNLNITAEACPHHFILSEDSHDYTDANYKMNPPLAAKNDVAAVIEGLKNGVIDCIATDHAPHAPHEKKIPYNDAPNGIVGLETAIPLSFTYLVKTGVLSPLEFARKLAANPAKIIGLKKGLDIGDRADITIIDPNKKFCIAPERFRSKSRNTPFGGFTCYGKIMFTIRAGVVFDFKRRFTK